MSKSIVMTTMPGGLPDLPPHEDGLQLDYLDDGVRTGGYSCIGQVPGAWPSILVQVLASGATLDEMASAANRDKYIFIEDVAEGDPPTIPEGTRRFNLGWALAFLLVHGHAAEFPPGGVSEAVHYILDLHGITPEQWQHAHG